MGADGRYRVVSLLGTALLVGGSTLIANHPLARAPLLALPLLERLPSITLTGSALLLTVGTTVGVALLALAPLFEPRPRRILDTVEATQKRVVMAMVTLAAIGYFDYSYRLPRSTLLTLSGLLLAFVPMWLVSVQTRPTATPSRTIVIGDDPDRIARIARTGRESGLSIVGYVAPLGRYWNADEAESGARTDANADGVTFADGGVTDDSVTDGGVTDGGVAEAGLGEHDASRDAERGASAATPPSATDLEYLGGLSRLGSILRESAIDVAVLAFSRPDRAEFFGTLGTCHQHGVAAKVHRDHADSVLTIGADSADADDIVDIQLEPLNWYDHVPKRAFDVVFATVGLVVLAPVMAIIATAIKLDTEGPLFYSQERTTTFGETFEIAKFRSMVDDAEAESGAKLSEEDAGGVDPRVTRVGRVLRKTHLDEIPQLWSILLGHMSVVGPRPERPELEADIRTSVGTWHRRWFVKPGLTGLAQVNDVSSMDPAEKLRYDVLYIREQSFLFDVKIVIRQIWMVLTGG